jgi:hypothetical protein
LIAGAVKLQDGDDSFGALHAGEVVELTVRSGSEAAALIDKLIAELDADHLTAVPVGRLFTDAGARV